MLKNKNIVIGVCGGIAAYKVCDLVSRFKKAEANVYVIMTRNASNFINPLTFQSLSSNRVIVDMFDAPDYWDIKHISLAKKADAFIVAPATANIIGKLACGIADDMLSTTIMATKAPVIIALAMNTNMYENQILQQNILKLKENGCFFLEPMEGRLACGDTGKGKLADPELIKEFTLELLNSSQDLKDKTVIVTAGPTREPIDPVRFISNHSTGKMGYALAEKAVKRGAKVYLISGPTYLKPPEGVELIKINTANEMYRSIMKHFHETDIVIKSAAVSDYSPIKPSTQKIKKSDSALSITLEKNIDILYELGKNKASKVLVGFAMETENLIQNAQNKVMKKNLDFIVANDLTTEGSGFAHDTNVVKIIYKDGTIESLPLMTKLELSDIILDKILMIIK